MYVHRYGEGGPTVVLLHGIPGSSDSWRAVAHDLAADHEVLVPDLLGFGRSPRQDDVHAGAQADALAEALKVERASFVGHDFGGPVALSLFERRPELFASLTLMATNAFPDTPIPFPLSLVRAPVVGGAAARLLFSKPSLAMMLRRYGGSHIGDGRSVRRIFTDSLRHIEERYASYPATLASLDIPALVVWATDDVFFSVADGRRIADEIPDARLELLTGAGHFLPEQRPDEIAALVRHFLATTPARRPSQRDS